MQQQNTAQPVALGRPQRASWLCLGLVAACLLTSAASTPTAANEPVPAVCAEGGDVDAQVGCWTNRLDDGIRRLTAYSPAGTILWSTPLEVQPNPWQRAVTGLLEHKNTDQHQVARALLARALALGSRDTWALSTWESMGGGPVPELDPQPAPLSAEPWHESMPGFTAPLYGGRHFSTDELQGKVFILNFWATWCEPCIRELPHLSRLYEQYHERGLEVLALNFQEPPDVAFAFAQSLGLALPIGICTAEIESHFEIKSMPTVVLADRGGRIRARWEGYEDGVEKQLEALTLQMLDEPESPRRELGLVTRGQDRIVADWTRRARRDINGVASVRGASGEILVAASLTRSVDWFDARGNIEATHRVPADMGALRGATGAVSERLLSFRPGATRVVPIPGDTPPWDAPAPVFDIAIREDHVLLATFGGLYRATWDGSELRQLGEFQHPSGVEALADGWAVLDSGQITWLDGDFEATSTVDVDTNHWQLQRVGERSVAAAGESLTASAQGRFGKDGGVALAVAMASGQLAILDASSGEVTFRATLEKIGGLAAQDLDGDGGDELIVAAGRELVVLRSPNSKTQTASRTVSN